MAIKKSELYASLWASCDELRGGMDASQWLARIERWDVRTLRKKIGGMLYQRTALSKNTKKVISAEIGNLRNRWNFSSWVKNQFASANI